MCIRLCLASWHTQLILQWRYCSLCAMWCLYGKYTVEKCRHCWADSPVSIVPLRNVGKPYCTLALHSLHVLYQISYIELEKQKEWLGISSLWDASQISIGKSIHVLCLKSVIESGHLMTLCVKLLLTAVWVFLKKDVLQLKPGSKYKK